MVDREGNLQLALVITLVIMVMFIVTVGSATLLILNHKGNRNEIPSVGATQELQPASP